MARLASDILAAAIVRVAESLGGSATIDRRGSSMSGAIFVTIYDRANGTYDLYEPASQALISTDNISQETRFFTLLKAGQERLELADHFEKEKRFDPDFWIVDVEGLSIDQLGEVVPTL